MSAASTLSSTAISTKNSLVLTTRADDVAISFSEFKEAIKNFSIRARANKNTPSINTKKALKEDVSVVMYSADKLEKALKNYGKLNADYQEKLEKYINQLKDFRVHMVPKLQSELLKKEPQYFYKIKRTNNFQQNLRNNVTMRKTRPKNITNSTTGAIIKPIEYISMPQLDMVLSDILPERSYLKIHPHALAAAAANVEGPANLFGSNSGGRRKTHKRRRHSRRN